MDAHVPQRPGVVRLSRTALRHRWPAWLGAIAWGVLLAVVPWWMGLPLLLALAIAQLAGIPRLHAYGGVIRRALRWGFAGFVVAGYAAFGGHALGLTLGLLLALVGFSLLVLLESWQDHKTLRSTAVAQQPEWSELALAPIGPAAAVIELQPPAWQELDGTANRLLAGAMKLDERSCLVAGHARIDNVEPRVAIAPGQDWLALPIADGRGVVLYDRVRDRQYRLDGWQLYGWHAGEAWLHRDDDHAPLALSHVLAGD